MLRWLLVVALIALPTISIAHEAPKGWAYDWMCCSDKDCHEIPAHQTPRVISSGYVLHDGEFIEKDSPKKRDSKDVFWHRCDVKDPFRMVAPVLRCLYVPQGGS